MIKRDGPEETYFTTVSNHVAPALWFGMADDKLKRGTAMPKTRTAPAGEPWKGGRMIDLLRIHALVRWARVLVYIGLQAEGLSVTCRHRAKSILVVRFNQFERIW